MPLLLIAFLSHRSILSRKSGIRSYPFHIFSFFFGEVPSIIQLVETSSFGAIAQNGMSCKFQTSPKLPREASTFSRQSGSSVRTTVSIIPRESSRGSPFILPRAPKVSQWQSFPINGRDLGFVTARRQIRYADGRVLV